MIQKGINIKKKSSHHERSSKRSTASSALSASSSASMSSPTASRPGGYFDDSAAVLTVRSCGDLVEPNCHAIINGLVPLTGRFGVPTGRRCSGPSIVSQHPDSRRSAWTIVVGPSLSLSLVARSAAGLL